jgi:hypothetical protein
MSKRQTWFGTRGNERWVPTPSINPDYGRSGFEARADYANGEAGIRQSKNAHNTYVLSWGPTKSRADIRTITDFADGVYDDQDGVNLIYWIDPMSRDANVLSSSLATPALATEDATPLLTRADGSGRPDAVATPVNSFRYPKRGARYAQFPTSVSIENYIPIPPGFSAWVGIHGDPSADGVLQVQPVNGYENAGAAITPVNLGLGETLVNTEISSGAASGLVLKVTPTNVKRFFTLYALVVQILPTGVAPTPGEFISGQGNAGCQFVGRYQKTPYSARYDRVALTARLEETGLGL